MHVSQTQGKKLLSFIMIWYDHYYDYDDDDAVVVVLIKAVVVVLIYIQAYKTLYKIQTSVHPFVVHRPSVWKHLF